MTKYFLKDTPLAELERQMMTPPNFSPRGGGQTVLCRFRYRPEDVVCKHCTEYRRGGCTEEVCPWLEERVEAGTVTYTSLAAEFYRKWLGTALGERIQELLRGKRSIAYYDSAHTDRLALYALFLARHRSDHRALAAMYLLTVTETLRRCAIPRIFDLWGIDIRSWSAVRTLSEQEYVLFQAAKGIWQSQRTITIPELCDRKLVEEFLKARQITHLFDTICTSCEVNKGKPAPDVYLKAAGQLGAEPSACLVFEDVPMGILAGKNAGMRVCAVDDWFSRPQDAKKRELADYFIHSYEDITNQTYEVL